MERRWDDLPAAHGAAIAFDLLTLLGLLAARAAAARRAARARMLGVALAYAWAAYPYTLFVLDSNSNDSLVAGAAWRAAALAGARARAPARGAADRRSARPRSSRRWRWRRCSRPRPDGAPLARRARGSRSWSACWWSRRRCRSSPHGGLRELYDRTLGYQAGRASPFSDLGPGRRARAGCGPW